MSAPWCGSFSQSASLWSLTAECLVLGIPRGTADEVSASRPFQSGATDKNLQNTTPVIRQLRGLGNQSGLLGGSGI